MMLGTVKIRPAGGESLAWRAARAMRQLRLKCAGLIDLQRDQALWLLDSDYGTTVDVLVL